MSSKRKTRTKNGYRQVRRLGAPDLLAGQQDRNADLAARMLKDAEVAASREVDLHRSRSNVDWLTGLHPSGPRLEGEHGDLGRAVTSETEGSAPV